MEPSVTYNYTTGANNGKISSEVYNGETVSYTYDSLNRLLTAAGSGWAENYGYDSFGNLVSKTPTAGSPPTMSIGVNQSNNQIVGYTYDANGNQTAASGSGLTYDSENRVIATPTTEYAYDSHNQRVWVATYSYGPNMTSQMVFFYGVDGKMLAEYNIGPGGTGTTVQSDAIYFGSKKVGVVDQAGVIHQPNEDRLGSAYASSTGGSYYPWGEGKAGNNPSDAWSFATYWRDSATGLDYANQRYYSNAYGRFMSVDPDLSSANGTSPLSWNRYLYA